MQCNDMCVEVVLRRHRVSGIRSAAAARKLRITELSLQMQVMPLQGQWLLVPLTWSRLS
jgi:hypothetical protein